MVSTKIHLGEFFAFSHLFLKKERWEAKDISFFCCNERVNCWDWVYVYTCIYKGARRCCPGTKDRSFSLSTTVLENRMYPPSQVATLSIAKDRRCWQGSVVMVTVLSQGRTQRGCPERACFVLWYSRHTSFDFITFHVHFTPLYSHTLSNLPWMPKIFLLHKQDLYLYHAYFKLHCISFYIWNHIWFFFI